MNGSDLSFSMLIRLMDGWSGPADKVRQSMRKMAQSSREMKREMGRKIKTGFSAKEIETAFARSERRIGDARGRLMGAAAMAVTLGAPVIQAGNFEEKLIDFANLAEIDAERVQKLKTELNALRDVTGQSNVQLLDGLATYVGKGMSLDAALKALPATGRAAKATKSQFDEMANSGYAVMDNLDVMPDRLRQAFDIMAKSGKEGSFELTAMARKFPEITAGAKSLKMEGVDAVASLSAALQIAMKSAGSEDQAATNMTNFLGKITATDTVKKFKEAGVDIEKEMQTALERGADPLLHMLQVIEKMTGGNAFKMGELFADKQVLDFLRAMIPNLEEYQRIKATALGADGVIDKDFEAVMKGFNEEWRQLKNSVAAMLGPSGALLPIFTDIMREVRFGVESVSAWTAANPELTATIVKGAAGLLAFGIATRVVGFGFAVMQGGILRTASLFLKFDKAGKNVSLIGRAARGAHWSVSRLYRGGRGLMRLMGKPLRWSIAPLRWATMIPKLRWAALLPKLSWRMLIPMLRWGLRFIPVIGWAALAGELLWSLLIKPLGWDKYIPEMSWDGFFGLFSWENALTVLDWSTWLLPIRWLDFIPGFKWKEVLSNLNWRKYIPRFQWRQRLRELDWREVVKAIAWGTFLPGAGLLTAWKALDGKVKWDWIVGKIGWPDLLTSKGLRDAWKNLKPSVSWASVVTAIEWATFLPLGTLGTVWAGLKTSTLWSKVITPIDWSTWFDFSWLDFLPKWDWWDIIGGPIIWTGKLAFNWKTVLPKWNWSDIVPEFNLGSKLGLTPNIPGAEGASSSAPENTTDQNKALLDLYGIDGSAPGMDGPAIDPYTRQFNDSEAAGNAIKQALTPLTQAIREGKERSLAPEASLHPEARPEPKAYEANQPNVTVESTFTSNPKVDVNVQVNMPLTIKREQKADNSQIAKRAGREAGAATERAVRRSLDDAANVE